jgi:uncharacterized protein (DUF433 family)
MTDSSVSLAKPADGATTSIDVIAKVPGMCGGDPIIVGTRIRVADIVTMRRNGYTTGAIIRAHPGLHKKWIQAAMQYYRSHQSEIDEYIRLDI